MTRLTMMPTRSSWAGFDRRRRGAVLIVTMFIAIALAGLVVVFAEQVQFHSLASANRAAQTQASFIARGGLQYAIGQLAAQRGQVPDPELLAAEAMPLGGGFFWLLRSDPDQREGLVFGIGDEAAKLNINRATPQMLIELPGMSDELAAAIVDWRDSDAEPQPGGAESSYYLALADGYYASDRPFETLEELLFLRGGDRDLIYGEDANRNQVLDPGEDDRGQMLPQDNGDGVLDRGLADYLTVYTTEPNRDAAGQPRLNVNEAEPAALLELVERVVGAAQAPQVYTRLLVNRPFANLLDLYFRVGLTEAQLDGLTDSVTTTRQMVLQGLVNVNTAPLEVLAALPGLTGDDAVALIAARRTRGPGQRGLGWVTGVITRPKAMLAGEYLTDRSFQFSVDVVAVSPRGRSFKRYLAVIDAAGQQVRVLHFEDLTALGWPLEPDLLEQIRSGRFTGSTSVPVIATAS